MSASVFATIPLFTNLQPHDLETLERVISTHRSPAKTVIFSAHEAGQTLFIITVGRVKVSAMTHDGREIILAILKRSDFFGEMSLLDGKPRSATVTAVEDTELLVLQRDDFLAMLDRNPQLALRMLETMATRLRKTDRRVESLALMSVYGRIAGILLQLAEEDGIRVGYDVIIPHRPLHVDIAKMAGTTRETVTRVLNDLRERGYLKLDGRRMTIIGYPGFEEEWMHLGDGIDFLPRDHSV